MVLQTLRRVIPIFSGPSNSVSTEIKGLADSYIERDKKFEDWHKLLNLDDQLFQKDMESFVGNDPRTTWNMGTYLLQPRPFTHSIITSDGTNLPTSITPFANTVTKYFTHIWQQIDKSDVRRGRTSWFWHMIGLMLATGWYAMPHQIKPDGTPWADYWNPANVYPDFSDDTSEGMVRLARLREISSMRAKRLVDKNGWSPRGSFNNKVLHGQLWKKDAMGNVTYSEALNNEVFINARELLGFKEIPVEVGMTGGIPGLISEGSMGQGILATNEPIFHNMNKQMTFMQQLLRDTANPRWWEKVVGKQSIIGNPDNLYKRGAKFTMGINEDMGALQMPPIPVELTQIVFNLRNQMQRGGFSDLTFGNVLSEVSAVLVSQAAEAAQQLLSPFHTSIQIAISSITNGWYRTLLANRNLWPSSWSQDIDVTELENTRIVSSYPIKVPGDLANRINQARLLNPDFRLSAQMVMELTLPEISDPIAAMRQLEADSAKRTPEYIAIQLINSFVRLAREAAASGAREDAAMYTILASKVREEITGQPGIQARTGVDGTVSSNATRRTGVER